MLNQVVLVGKVAAKRYAEITVKVDRPYKDSDGNIRFDMIDIILEEGLVDRVLECCTIGDIVEIKGRVQTRNEHSIIIAEKMTFLTSKNTEGDEDNDI